MNLEELQKELNGYSFSKDIAIDTAKEKRLECKVTIGNNEKIVYFLFHCNVFIEKYTDLNKALEQYDNIR